MPIYVRRCLTCRHVAEQVAKAKDCDKLRCPECGGATEPDPSQFATISTHGDELHGAKSRLWDKTIAADEIPEVKKAFAGIDARIEKRGKLAHVYVNGKAARKQWHDREQLIAAKARARRGEPI